ncbi:hypothetical protein C8R46DRAFT_1083033 [Mycena filopes]|nr:hypothetical protein C8R46DRAFT_1083033 [Mycena filopes]
MTRPSPAPVYTTLSIPTVTARPSLSCLQWSGDGQVFFLSKGSVYILTPDRGVHSDTQLPDHVPRSHVRWFSTMIDFNPREVHNWPAGSQGCSVGFVWAPWTVGLRAISCSPSNLTGNGGAAKNTIKGEWAKICEATPLIAELISTLGPYSKTEQMLRSQISSLLWSSHADFALSPAPCLDSSFLATGTRAGTIMLFRFKHSSLEHVITVELATEWITHLAFSRWTLVKAGQSEIILAYGLANGSVKQMKIIQTLSSLPSSSGFALDYTIQTTVETSETPIFQPTKTGITALSWIFPGDSAVLVRATPGVVSLWSGGSPNLRWSGERVLHLSSPRLSVGSSSVQPVSGLHYARHEDALFVSLFDGSIHVIDSLVHEPRLSNASKHLGDQTSEGLSGILRATFARAEKLKVSQQDVNRVSGMIPYDDYSVAIWVQESAQPANFDYKYDVLHESTFVGKPPARLCAPLTHDMILLELRTILNSANASSGSTPLFLLRPIFLHVQDLLELRPRVLEILSANAAAFPPSPVVPPWSGEPDPQFRADFRKSLKQHLFGCNVLLSLRLRLCVAEFCWASRWPNCRLLSLISNTPCPAAHIRRPSCRRIRQPCPQDPHNPGFLHVEDSLPSRMRCRGVPPGRGSSILNAHYRASFAAKCASGSPRRRGDLHE